MISFSWIDVSIYILYIHTYIYMLYWQKYIYTHIYIFTIDVYTYIWHGFGLSRHWMIFFIHVIHSKMDIRLSAFDLSWRIGMWRTILASQKYQVKRHGCIPHQPYHWKKPPSICCCFCFFPTELLMKLSDWVRKWSFDHPNGGHPWPLKRSLKTSKKPNKWWIFHGKTSPNNDPNKRFAKLCGLSLQDPLHAAAMAASSWGDQSSLTGENGFHDPTGGFLEEGNTKR